MQQTITCLSRLGLNPLVLFLSANLLAGSGEAQALMKPLGITYDGDADPIELERNTDW